MYYLRDKTRRLHDSILRFCQTRIDGAEVGDSLYRNNGSSGIDGDGYGSAMQMDDPEYFAYTGDTGGVLDDDDGGGIDDMAIIDQRKHARRDREVNRGEMASRIITQRLVNTPVIDVQEAEHHFRFVKNEGRHMHLETRNDYDLFAASLRAKDQGIRDHIQQIERSIGADAQ